MPTFRSRSRARWISALLCGGSLILAAAPGGASPAVQPAVPTWNLGLRTTTYAFQTEELDGQKTDQFRFFQQFSGGATGLAGGRLSLHTSGRFCDLPAEPSPVFARSRLYTGYLEAAPGARTRIRLGRQLLQTGASFLTMDGVLVDLRGGPRFSVGAWAGAKAPYGTVALGSFDDDPAAGLRCVARPRAGQRLVLAAGYRERAGLVAERPLSLEYAVTASSSLRAQVRTVYDLEGARWSRLEFQTQWRGDSGRPAASFQYVDRFPGIDAASWFARFTDLERIRLARAAVRWESARRFGGELECLGSFVGDRRATRLGIAALLPPGRIGYALRGGDVGDESSFYGEAGWQALSWLRLEGEASYLTYALIADAPEEEERDLTTFAVRARARLRPGLNLTAEVQSLDNPLYEKDVRLLVGMDLNAGRGASRFGLDRGGWLR